MITCRFCKQYSNLPLNKTTNMKKCDVCGLEVSADSEMCRKGVADGTFYCPIMNQYTHIGTCIGRCERPNNHSRTCNRKCKIYQMREIIIARETPVVWTKLRKR